MYTVPLMIEAGRLLLRRFHAGDLVQFTRFMTNPQVTRYLTFPEAMKTADGAKQVLESTLSAYDSDKPLFALAVEERVSHAFVGCCGGNPLNEGEIEIFYALLPEYWGQGMATDMTRILTSFLLDQKDVGVVKAFIVPEHEASRRVVEKVGFRNMGLVTNPNFCSDQQDGAFPEKVLEYILEQQGD